MLTATSAAAKVRGVPLPMTTRRGGWPHEAILGRPLAVAVLLTRGLTTYCTPCHSRGASFVGGDR